jgi:hypothetical protein
MGGLEIGEIAFAKDHLGAFGATGEQESQGKGEDG